MSFRDLISKCLILLTLLVISSKAYGYTYNPEDNSLTNSLCQPAILCIPNEEGDSILDGINHSCFHLIIDDVSEKNEVKMFFIDGSSPFRSSCSEDIWDIYNKIK